MAMKETSLVRENLMTQMGYSPYCGAEICRLRWPRTSYRLGQFQCGCGWRSEFPDDFISRYEAKWSDVFKERHSAGRAALSSATTDEPSDALIQKGRE